MSVSEGGALGRKGQAPSSWGKHSLSALKLPQSSQVWQTRHTAQLYPSNQDHAGCLGDSMPPPLRTGLLCTL